MSRRGVLRLFIRLELAGLVALVVIAALLSSLVLAKTLVISALSPDVDLGWDSTLSSAINWFLSVFFWGAIPTLAVVVPFFAWLMTRNAVNPFATLLGAAVIGVVSSAAFGSIAPFFVIAVAVALLSFVVSRPGVFGVSV